MAEIPWERVDAILDEVLDAPEDRRDALLLQRCGGDEALERRVRELVQAAGEPSPLDRPAAQQLPTLAADPGSAPSAVEGEVLGAYRVLGLLGEGGMGRVYLAERADGEFERRVALKIVSSSGAGETVQRRFRRERQILANLRHDHIAQLLDAGVAADGRPWFALELVDGVPITRYAKEQRLSREERIRLVLQACSAVAHAHGQGVVHRDLKPSNLLVSTSADATPHLFVLDFGIARSMGEADLTATGDVIGTPGYMAPEQARGEVETVDRRADVFALGVILYELLCERRPFVGDTPLAVLGAVMASDPASPRSLVADLPRDLETIVLTCLEKAAERRYPSVRALIDDLQRYLAGEPIAARPTGWWRRGVRLARRHPLWVAACVALLVSALVGWQVGAHGRRLAAEQAEVSRRFGAVSEQVAAAMRFEHLAPRHDTEPARRRLLAQLLALEAELEGLSPAVQGTARVALGRGFLALGDWQRAARELETAWQLGDRSPRVALALAEAEAERYGAQRALAEQQSDPVLRARRLVELERRSRDRALELAAIARSGGEGAVSDLVEARLAYLAGELERAATLATAAAEAVPWLYEARLLVADVEVARLGQARRAGVFDDIDGHLERSLAVLRMAIEVGESDPAAYRRLCQSAALGLDLLLHVVEGRADDLAREGLEACRAASATLGGDVAPLEQAAALMTLYAREQARADSDPFGSIDQAIGLAQEAVEAKPDSAEGYRRLGDAWAFRAEFEREAGQESRPSLERATAALQRGETLDPSDPGVYNSLGLVQWEYVWRALEHHEDFAPAAEAAVEAFSRAVELEPDYAYAWGNLGTMYNKLAENDLLQGADPSGHLAQARAAFERCLAIYPDYSTGVNNLGNVLYFIAESKEVRGGDARREYAEAAAMFDRAAELKPDWFVPRFGQARTALALAGAQVRHGESPDEALRTTFDALDEAFARRRSLVHGLVLAGEAHLFQAEHQRHLGLPTGPSFAAARQQLRAVLSLNADMGVGLALGIEQFQRGEPTAFYPHPET